ncbi:hypothetical protein VPHG_00035 [Vibrio phage 11895-B1]|uniref:hypothetical protein n=1 Tax=Vibrio phage 11895-B1 TaxID=754075 RepID=UPI0002C13BBC|nr:hypothetical protein VPHG_00035 [Vibrio phage 11895-B1]AGH32102.1 hypothetical protein VPHG_00035 [Vibrio phage 11895-B1]
MKTLVSIIKSEDGFTHYEEVCRKSGKVMIQDYMESDRFQRALELDCGFESLESLLVDLTAQATKPLVECKETLNLFRKVLGLKWKDLPKNTTDQFNAVRRLAIK